MPLPERNAARKLVADENADRANLYREIAAANGHPEWEADIRTTFAERWVSKAARGLVLPGRGRRVEAEIAEPGAAGPRLGRHKKKPRNCGAFRFRVDDFFELLGSVG